MADNKNINLSKMKPEQLVSLLKDGEVVIDGEGGKKVKLEVELDWKMYLLGQCGNRSFGFMINSLKISEGTPNIGEKTLKENKERYTGTKETKVDADGSGKAPGSEVVPGDLEANASDYSVAMHADAERKDIHLKLGLPKIKRKPKPFEFEDNIDGDSGFNFGDQV